MFNRVIQNVQTILDLEFINSLLPSVKCMDVETRDWCLEPDTDIAREFGRKIIDDIAA